MRLLNYTVWIIGKISALIVFHVYPHLDNDKKKCAFSFEQQSNLSRGMVCLQVK